MRQDKDAAKKQKHRENETENQAPLSPLIQKSYDFKRPKVTVTMEELENADDSEEDDSYETNAGIPGTSQRLQPKRNCKINETVASDDDEGLDTSSNSEVIDYPEEDSEKEENSDGLDDEYDTAPKWNF